jgi:hypothetical protein
MGTSVPGGGTPPRLVSFVEEDTMKTYQQAAGTPAFDGPVIKRRAVPTVSTSLADTAVIKGKLVEISTMSTIAKEKPTMGKRPAMPPTIDSAAQPIIRTKRGE